MSWLKPSLIWKRLEGQGVKTRAGQVVIVNGRKLMVDSNPNVSKFCYCFKFILLVYSKARICTFGLLTDWFTLIKYSTWSDIVLLAANFINIYLVLFPHRNGTPSRYLNGVDSTETPIKSATRSSNEMTVTFSKLYSKTYQNSKFSFCFSGDVPSQIPSSPIQRIQNILDRELNPTGLAQIPPFNPTRPQDRNWLQVNNPTNHVHEFHHSMR